MGFFQLHIKQEIPTSIDEVWNFISSPENLKKITPSSMGFNITSELKNKNMYPGMIISYQVRPLLGIKTTWVTEITHVKEKEYFVDEQRVGPYSMWHHEHFIEPSKNGVLMTDIVSYQPPFGFLGSIANSIIIKRKLNNIFEFRRIALERIYGKI